MARDDRDLIVVEREGGGAFKWLLLGAAVGAGLALLFAPKSGKDTRRELGRSLRSLRDLADETLDEFKGERGEAEHDLRSMADGAGAYEDDETEAEEPAPAPKKERPSAVSAREELERRLAAARARRRQPVPDDDEEPVA